MAKESQRIPCDQPDFIIIITIIIIETVLFKKMIAVEYWKFSYDNNKIFINESNFISNWCAAKQINSSKTYPNNFIGASSRWNKCAEFQGDYSKENVLFISALGN